jgi:hypothetical protein
MGNNRPKVSRVRGVRKALDAVTRLRRLALAHGLSRALALLGCGASVVLAGLLSGCATPVHRPGAAAREQDFRGAAGWTPIAEWQRQLGDHVAHAGGGDPAVLSRLPILRSPAALRPGLIVFAAVDIDAVVSERDGYDVFGLLVGKRPDPAGPWYIFIVGTIERRDYRPAAVEDVRIAAMTVRGGRVVWETGPSEAQALARYKERADAATVLRFPGNQDNFVVVPCNRGICVEERGSGARWSIDLDARPTPAQALARPIQSGDAGGT